MFGKGLAMVVVAGTGHRPTRLGGYSDAAFNRLVRFAEDRLLGLGPDSVISGMAQGWDQALAQACVNLGIPFDAAVPFSGQEDRWPGPARARYSRLLGLACSVCVVCEGGYAPWKMQRRNEHMVDNCTHLLALCDGSPGGTSNCLEYAMGKGVAIVNAWEEWVKFQ